MPFSQIKAFLYDLFTNQFFLSFIVIFIGLLLVATKNIILSRWHHTFDETHFSSQTFYDTLELTLKAKEINNLGARRITHKQIHLVGARREYLRIYRRWHAFEICAAHVGTGCYVSWWFFEKNTFLKRVLKYIPIANLFLNEKTYHQIDEEDAFRDIVHKCVLESIDAMTGTKGSTLSEAERSIIRLRSVTTS